MSVFQFYMHLLHLNKRWNNDVYRWRPAMITVLEWAIIFQYGNVCYSTVEKVPPYNHRFFRHCIDRNTASKRSTFTIIWLVKKKKKIRDFRTCRCWRYRYWGIFVISMIRISASEQSKKSSPSQLSLFQSKRWSCEPTVFSCDEVQREVSVTPPTAASENDSLLTTVTRAEWCVSRNGSGANRRMWERRATPHTIANSRTSTFTVSKSNQNGPARRPDNVIC